MFDAPHPAAVLQAWAQLSRLGEAQLLLPAQWLAAAWLAAQPGGRRPAVAWLAGTAVAAALTTASKVAFIGYGWGWAALDFTGVSGHAMFATAIWPVLGRLLGGAAGAPVRGALQAGAGTLSWSHAGPVGRPWGAWLGWAVALGVAVSRVPLQAHSWSEVLCGSALGAAVALGVARAGPWPRVRLPWWTAPAALAAMALAVGGAPPSRTHDWVTRLALAQSGRAQPFLRADLHRSWAAAPRPPLRAPAAGSLQPR